MQCEQFETRWQQLLDERLPLESDPHLVAHSLSCDDCAARLASVERLMLGLDLAECPGLPPDFAERVAAAATTPSGRSAVGWQLVLSCVVSVAAAVVLCVWLLPSLSSRDVVIRPAPAPAGGGETAPAVPAADMETPAPADVRRLVAELAERFPRDEATRAIQRLDTSVARPITNSFETAVTAIYRTIPVRRTETTSAPDKSAEFRAALDFQGLV